jgi:acetyl-CoA synthetase
MSATEAYRAARDQLVELRTDYARAVAEFRWPELGDRFNWAIDWFDAFATGNDKPALIIVEEDGTATSRTFDEMVHRSDQVASWLSRQGIGKGDPIILMLGNQVELWESMLAIMKLGAIILPTTTAVGPAELADRLQRGHARAVIANPSDAPKFTELPGDFLRFGVGSYGGGWQNLNDAFSVEHAQSAHPGTSPSDPLLYYFTSGTTSLPKLVEHTQVSYPVGHLSTFYWIGIEPGGVHLNISSPGWAKHAWSCFFAPWIAEATIFIYNYARFDAAALLTQMREKGVTSFCAPPTVWRMLINADLSGGPGALRQLVGAGEPLNPEVISQVEKQWGMKIRDGFGQTETTCQVGNTPGQRLLAGSMGRPLPGVPVVLVAPLTNELVEGVGEGEICLDLSKDPLPLMTGYLGDPARTAEATAGGFYHSGDVATRDEHGYLTYVGRTDDVFKASDYKISPFELESVLIECPAVAEAAVVPAPDAVRLAVPKAYIALAPGWEPTRETAFTILKYARENLAPYLRVRRIEFFDLPKTISGKIRRVELRGRERDLADTDARTPGEYRDEDFPELKS